MVKRALSSLLMILVILGILPASVASPPVEQTDFNQGLASLSLELYESTEGVTVVEDDDPSPSLILAAGGYTVLVSLPKDNIIIPSYMYQLLFANVAVYDSLGNAISNPDVDWSIDGPYIPTVAISGSGVITVGTMASPGILTVRATYQGVSGTASFRVVSPNQVASVSVSVTPNSLTIPKNGSFTLSAMADILDSGGNVLGHSVSWYISSHTGVSINVDTGLITVSPNADPGTVTVSAKVNGTVYSGDPTIVTGTAVLTLVEPSTLPTSSLSMGISMGTQFVISLKGANMNSFGGITFMLTYDPNMLELLDFAAQTDAYSLSVGGVTDTPLTIVSHESGSLVFTVDKTIPSGKTWSGLMTLLRFKSLSSGQTDIIVGNAIAEGYVTIGSKPIGSIVQIPINGVLRDFIVVQHGMPSAIYDDSLKNGTILLMKDIYEMKAWDDSGNFSNNDYQNSTINAYLNNTFYDLIGTDTRNQIKQIKIPYRPGSGTSTTVNSGANGLSVKVFLLSGCELNWTAGSEMPADGATLSYFAGTAETDSKRVALINGAPAYWYLRTPGAGSIPGGAWHVTNTGARIVNFGVFGVRPAFVLPSSYLVPDGGGILSSPSQAQTAQGMQAGTDGQGPATDNTQPLHEQAALPPKWDAISVFPTPKNPDEDE